MKNLLLVPLVTLPSSWACGFHSVSHTSGVSGTDVRRSTSSPQGKIAIENVRVFNGRSMSRARTVCIDKDRISSCHDNVTEVIDGSGRFLIPGLIDSHVHLQTVRDLETITSYGITTVFNMACYNYTDCDLLRNHEGLADFYRAGIPAIGATSKHAHLGPIPPEELIGPNSDPVEMVNRALGNHSDYYKITVEIGGPSQTMQGQLVKAAHARNVQTMSHASDIESYRQAIMSQSDGLQHTPDDGNLTESSCKNIVRNGQFVTPTMTIHKAMWTNPVIMKFLRGSDSPGNSSWSNVVANIRTMYQADVPLLAGTDAVGTIIPNITLPYGLTLHQELQQFVVEIGMSPAEAINAATTVPARYHRVRDRGIIAPGMRADLILLRSNPLVNISNTLDIERIWVAGRGFGGMPE